MQQKCFGIESILLYLPQQKHFTMRMYTRAFNKMSELNAFANEHGIGKDSIVNIFPSGDGSFLLVYYAE